MSKATRGGDQSIPHEEHQSAGQRPVKLCWDQTNNSFYLELYKNKFKNLIRTSKFIFSFRGLSKPQSTPKNETTNYVNDYKGNTCSMFDLTTEYQQPIPFRFLGGAQGKSPISF